MEKQHTKYYWNDGGVGGKMGRRRSVLLLAM
jgi:hypothetical protein